MLLGGVWVTIQVTILAALLAIAMSFLAGLGRMSGNRVVRTAARIYIELFRGTSLVAQLFWVFFVLPQFGISLSALVSGVIAIGLCNGAYGSEIVRGAIEAVPRGQREAAVALNFTSAQTFRHVVLPQAAVVMVPLFGSLVIEILKGSALVSLITLADLTFQAKNIILVHVNTAPVLTVVLIIYFCLALVISSGSRRLERVLARSRDPAVH
jgi:polar amino acid transport system permease protein